MTITHHIFFVLCSVGVIYILTFILVLILPNFKCHFIIGPYLGVRFTTILLINIVLVHPLSNKNQKTLKFLSTPLCNHTSM